MDSLVIHKRQQQVLYDKKWKKFLKRSWVFKHLPFVDFALAAGSMATGNVRLESDFDVIIGAKFGRIFTARFFAVVVFGAFGWRRRKLDHREAAADKICLNHFVTEKSYCLAPPHNNYWKNLYLNLVPIFGELKSVLAFWEANRDWLGAIPDYQDDLRHKYRYDSVIKKMMASVLSGDFGNWLESVLKKVQIKKIERSLAFDTSGYKPRIRYGDAELEFHPDTRRIEQFKINIRL